MSPYISTYVTVFYVDWQDRQTQTTVYWPLFQDNLGKPAPERSILDFNDGVAVALARPFCTLLQTDNHASTSSLNFFTGRMLFLSPNQQC